MNTRARTAGLIKDFFSSTNYAVVGASTDSSKYGNKKETEIEGLSCVPDLSSLPNFDPNNTSISIITQPNLGISRIWLQPGAENIECLEYANKVGLQIISGGPCVL
ncbi:14397_t:CDS:2, partial [Cetraspora pellucida]